eukprot:TRINITY_DN1310_c0_g1_i4.p1 TRINITY_DN1310_c0_g1~~TRINITY_DN1310_c0_g1_i4.p1  ORF type:complete len:598 (-),score=192.28 TRINITY_DN1310_c0_g1_i4:262-2055(-)
MPLILACLERMAKANSPRPAIVSKLKHGWHLDVEHEAVAKLIEYLDQQRPGCGIPESERMSVDALDREELDRLVDEGRFREAQGAGAEVSMRRQGLISTKNVVSAKVMRGIKKQAVPGPIHIARLQDNITGLWPVDDSFFETSLVGRQGFEQHAQEHSLDATGRVLFASLLAVRVMREMDTLPEKICKKWSRTEREFDDHRELVDSLGESVEALNEARRQRQVTCSCGANFAVSAGKCTACEERKRAKMEAKKAPTPHLTLDRAVDVDTFAALEWERLRGSELRMGGLGSAGVIICEFEDVGAVVLKPVKRMDVKDFVARALFRVLQSRTCGGSAAASPLARSLQAIGVTRSVLTPLRSAEGQRIKKFVQGGKWYGETSGVHRFSAMFRCSPFIGAQEFVVGGQTLYNPNSVAWLSEHGRMHAMGCVIGFDMVINNWDRIPFAWNNFGNAGNLLVRPDGTMVSIDQAVGVITNDENRTVYFERTRTLLRSVRRWLACGSAQEARADTACEEAVAALDRVVEFFALVTGGVRVTEAMQREMALGVVEAAEAAAVAFSGAAGALRADVLPFVPEQLREEPDIDACIQHVLDIAPVLKAH